MSPFAQTSLTYQLARPFRASSLPLWITTNVTRVNIVTFAVLLIVCLAYIVQVNSTTSKGYQIRDLETMIGMVPVDRAVYVDVREGSVAFAK
jgi:hypothetical protein